MGKLSDSICEPCTVLFIEDSSVPRGNKETFSTLSKVQEWSKLKPAGGQTVCNNSEFILGQGACWVSALPYLHFVQSFILLWNNCKILPFVWLRLWLHLYGSVEL